MSGSDLVQQSYFCAIALWFRSIVALHSFRLKLCSVKCIVHWHSLAQKYEAVTTLRVCFSDTQLTNKQKVKKYTYSFFCDTSSKEFCKTKMDLLHCSPHSSSVFTLGEAAPALDGANTGREWHQLKWCCDITLAGAAAWYNQYWQFSH